jgi:hypothetical protein
VIEFRRAALHFLGILNKAYNVYETETIEKELGTRANMQVHLQPNVLPTQPRYPPVVLQRLKTITQYLVATDRDDVLKVMAQELRDSLPLF